MLHKLTPFITLIISLICVANFSWAGDITRTERNPLDDQPLIAPEASLRNNVDFLEEGSSTLFPVAVIDSGIDYTHKDLSPFLHKNLKTSALHIGSSIVIMDEHGWDFNEEDNRPFDNNYNFEAHFETLPSTKGQSALDKILNIGKVLLKNGFELIKGIMFMGSPGHGTHVSGIILKQCKESCSIVPIKIFGQEVSSLEQLVKALEYVQKRNYKLVNLSLGIDTQYMKDQGSIEYQHLEKIIEIMKASKETLFVVAAGNNGNYISEEMNSIYPAILNAPNIITVGAVDNEGELASFSNFNPDIVDIFAPGVEIHSTWNDGEYKSISGTSMSTPYVAGLMAYLWSKHPNLNPEKLKQRFLKVVPLRTLSFEKHDEDDSLLMSVTIDAPVVLDSDRANIITSF